LSKIVFYEDINGREPVVDYIKELAKKNDKDSRIKLNKILDYISLLEEYGTWVGMPYVKHIEGDLWELRPLRDRIFFFVWENGKYILLHVLVLKDKNKTPPNEIEKARREIKDILERGGERYEQ